MHVLGVKSPRWAFKGFPFDSPGFLDFFRVHNSRPGAGVIGDVIPDEIELGTRWTPDAAAAEKPVSGQV